MINSQNSSTTAPQIPNSITQDIAEKIGEGIGEEIIAFFIVFVIILIRDKLLHIAKTRKIKSYYFSKDSNHLKVKSILIEIMDELDTDRVLLLSLHNGENFLNKISHIKCTLTHQYTQKGITEIPMIKELPITSLEREIEMISDQKNTHWLNVEEAHPRCKNYLENIGVELYGSRMIKNRLKIPIAIFGVHFCSKENQSILQNKEKLAFLEKKLNEIEKILS